MSLASLRPRAIWRWGAPPRHQRSAGAVALGAFGLTASGIVHHLAPPPAWKWSCPPVGSAFSEGPMTFLSLISPALHPQLEDDDLCGAWGALPPT